MKRILPLLAGASCLCGTLVAQPASQPNTAPLTTVAQINAQKWDRAFAQEFVPNESNEPRFTSTEHQPIIDALRSIGTLISSGEILGFQNALATLTPLVNQADLVATKPEQVTTHPTLLFTVGAIHQQIGNLTENQQQAQRSYGEAIRYFEAALLKFPNYQRAHRSLGQLFMQLSGSETGDTDEARERSKEYMLKAIPHLQRSIALGGQDAATFALLGFAYFSQENYFSAEACLKNALVLDPTNENVRVLLAQTLLLQERYREARALFEELVKSKPDKVEWWLALVNTYLPEDKVDEAARILELVRQMGGGRAESYQLLGNIYITRQMYDLAAEVFVSALERFGESYNNPNVENAPKPAAFLEAVNTLASYSAFDEANAVIAAIEANIGDRLTEQERLQLLTAESRIAIQTGDAERASEILEQIVEQDPTNADALNALGSYYGQIIEKPTESGDGTIAEPRNLQRAIFMLERAEDSNDPRARMRALQAHAQILVRQQDTESLREAVELLERSQSIEPQQHVERYIQQIRDNLAARSARG